MHAHQCSRLVKSWARVATHGTGLPRPKPPPRSLLTGTVDASTSFAKGDLRGNLPRDYARPVLNSCHHDQPVAPRRGLIFFAGRLMAEYTKPWLPVDEQIERLVGYGVEMEDRDRAASVLKAIGYYRLTGYLYPFRQSEQCVDDEGRARTRVLGRYQPGTTLRHAEDIIDFDRRLRMLVTDGVERIEVAMRMRIGYVLGRASPFAHEDPTCFTDSFTAQSTDVREPAPSKHVQWLQRVKARKASSDEQFVEHFRQRYDDRMPVWALTEILELGHLSVLYRGMNQKDAEEIATAFGVPTKSSCPAGSPA